MASKRKYGVWTNEDMQAALTALKNGECGFNECARRYNIPKPTLKRHQKCLNIRDEKAFGRLTTLTPQIEDQFVRHILEAEENFFGLTIKDIRSLAYQMAERNNISHNFNRKTQLAGKKWYYGFMKRHPNISLRQPESTSMARAKGFNRNNVNGFFDILEKICDENKLGPARIFNVDESGFSTVQKKNQKILAKKGKKYVGSISSGERGVNTTIVCCVSAAGQYVPPMIIFKRKRMANELKTGAPPGSLVEVSDTGYINSELFSKWLDHFIFVVKPTIDEKVLLVLDGHTTHSRNITALEKARQNGVILLQLPGHTTHRLQPLDVAFFKPLEAYYIQAVQKWLRTNPGLCITQYQITALLGEAYGRAATIATAMNGFKATGIWPVDRAVFGESDYAPAQNLATEFSTENSVDPNGAVIKDDKELPLQDSDIEMLLSSSPTAKILNDTSNLPSPTNVTIDDLSPLPRGKLMSKRTQRAAQKAVLLTSSPYKNALEESKLRQTGKKTISKKVKKENRSPKKTNSTKKKTIVKKNLSDILNVSPKASTSRTTEVEVEVVNEKDWLCDICEELAVEDMVKCGSCGKWSHERCAGRTKETKGDFTCHNCM